MTVNLDVNDNKYKFMASHEIYLSPGTEEFNHSISKYEFALLENS